MAGTLTGIDLLAVLLLAVSSSLDNFAAGVAYGMRRVCFPRSLNLLVALLNTAGTLTAMLLGTALTGLIGIRTAGGAGAALLIGTGGWIVAAELPKFFDRDKAGPQTDVRNENLLGTLLRILDDPYAAGLLCTGRVRLKEGAVLAAALTLTNLSSGIGAGMLRFSPGATGTAVFLCSFAALAAGLSLGRFSGALILRGISGVAAGVLLVMIGIYELAA